MRTPRGCIYSRQTSGASYGKRSAKELPRNNTRCGVFLTCSLITCNRFTGHSVARGAGSGSASDVKAVQGSAVCAFAARSPPSTARAPQRTSVAVQIDTLRIALARPQLAERHAIGARCRSAPRPARRPSRAETCRVGLPRTLSPGCQLGAARLRGAPLPQAGQVAAPASAAGAAGRIRPAIAYRLPGRRTICASSAARPASARRGASDGLPPTRQRRGSGARCRGRSRPSLEQLRNLGRHGGAIENLGSRYGIQIHAVSLLIARAAPRYRQDRRGAGLPGGGQYREVAAEPGELAKSLSKAPPGPHAAGDVKSVTREPACCSLGRGRYCPGRAGTTSRPPRDTAGRLSLSTPPQSRPLGRTSPAPTSGLPGCGPPRCCQVRTAPRLCRARSTRLIMRASASTSSARATSKGLTAA